jgi:uncharacterized Fe-S cluster-containing protein
MKFRKKPVVIEAECYDGTFESIKRILYMGNMDMEDVREIRNRPEGIYIETFKETIQANNGDWIILDAKGELYPCRPDIFDATYEPVY